MRVKNVTMILRSSLFTLHLKDENFSLELREQFY